MTNKTIQNSYDEVPYPSFAYPPTHPDHLATLATLSGMSPPPVAHCRVLELGCASGGNLIPMAYTLPESKFEGMDFSAREVADGQAILQALGLKNVTLNHLNILDVTSDFGQFDYIIVYGIYTWVNPAVQDRILEICRQNLVPNGVAYVSYNVYPGWHMNTIIRDVLLYHTRRTTKPQARIEQARALLKFMAESVPTENSLYGHFLRSMQEFLQPKPDAYLFHDFMEDVNLLLSVYRAGEAPWPAISGQCRVCHPQQAPGGGSPGRTRDDGGHHRD
jgi:SAM-dependent methyltransferase